MSRASVSSRLIRVVIVALLFLAFDRAAFAQTGTATINGQVTDESGAVLPGVTVTATSPVLQVAQVVTATDQEGRYRLTPLPIGTYNVTFELAGFKTVRREEIRLTVGFTARVDAAMSVGEQSDCFRGGHSGYERLAPPVSHVRTFIADKRIPRVLVTDRLAGAGVRRLTWRFHLDPAVDTELRGADIRLFNGGRNVWLLPDDAAAAHAFSIEDGWISQSYGVKAPTKILVWKAEARLPAEASYLFSDIYFSPQERRVVCEAMRRSSAC